MNTEEAAGSGSEQITQESEVGQGRSSTSDAGVRPSAPPGGAGALGPVATASPSGDPEAVPRAPTGFGKGVNDYLNQYVMVADAKAGAILAANLALSAALLDHKPATAPL
jgi:hypothetical protein